MKKLIIIEGIDNCGKSTIAKIIAKKLNFRHEHEPTFSSDYADELNFKKFDSYQRETLFILDRYNHQKILNEYNVVLDRYFYTGIAYAHAFSPESAQMVTSISRMHSIFKKPDIVIFINIACEDSVKLNENKKGTPYYNPKYNIETAKKIVGGYDKAIDEIKKQDIKYEIIHNQLGKIDETIERIYEIVKIFK